MLFPDNSEAAPLRHCGDAFPRPPELNAREPQKTLFPVSLKNIKQVQPEGGFIGMNLYGNYRLVYSIPGSTTSLQSLKVQDLQSIKWYQSHLKTKQAANSLVSHANSLSDDKRTGESAKSQRGLFPQKLLRNKLRFAVGK